MEKKIPGRNKCCKTDEIKIDLGEGDVRVIRHLVGAQCALVDRTGNARCVGCCGHPAWGLGSLSQFCVPSLTFADKGSYQGPSEDDYLGALKW